MASSGSSSPVSAAGFNFYIDWEIKSQSVNGSSPYSRLVAKISAARAQSGQWINARPVSYSISADGTSVGSASSQTLSDSGWSDGVKNVIFTTSEFTVYHNSDGSKTVSLTAVVDASQSGATLGTVNISCSAVLDSIAMSSGLSISTDVISLGVDHNTASITANITRHSSSYTHELRWSYGDYLEVDGPSRIGSSTSYTHTFNKDNWLPKFPNDIYATCTCTLYTYLYVQGEGYRQIGSPVSKTFTIACTSYPSVSLTVSPRGTAYDHGLTTYYYSGYSKALLSFTASGRDGSTVKTVELTQNGSTLKSYSTTSSGDHTTGVLSGTSPITYKAIVTDSRGRQSESTVSITLKSYSMPIIYSAIAVRCDENGNKSSSGVYLLVKATFACYGEGNSFTSRTVSASHDSNVAIQSATYEILDGGTYEINRAYQVTFKGTDMMGNTVTKIATVPTVSRIINVKDPGTGVAFGKFATQEAVTDSAWPIDAPILRVKSENEQARLELYPSVDNNKSGMVATTSASATNQMYFSVYHRSNNQNNSYIDEYQLPVSGTNSSSTVYKILTTKNYVSVLKTFSNVQVDQYGGVTLASFSSFLPAGATVVSYNIEGFSGAYPYTLATTSNGSSLYLVGSPNSTFTSLGVRIWYFI